MLISIERPINKETDKYVDRQIARLIHRYKVLTAFSYKRILEELKSNISFTINKINFILQVMVPKNTLLKMDH